ncbi:hypothetical protein [Planobispora rosea]|uniref:hypothetical protein n=1 Tax=Planobispora rosea TaxID=35762 RepID=UPI00083A5A99|nr:hypothetical protein [Planobispora rosea]
MSDTPTLKDVMRDLLMQGRAAGVLADTDTDTDTDADVAEAERAAELMADGIARLGDGPGRQQVACAPLAQIRQEGDR